MPLPYVLCNVCDMLIYVQVEKCDASVFTGGQPFNESKWDHLLIQILVATFDLKLSKVAISVSAVEPGIVQNVIEELKKPQCSKEQFYKSLLRLLFLALADPKVLTKEVIGFLLTLQKQNGYPQLISVEGVLRKLFSIYEEQAVIVQTAPFKYLPFQRAIPFFPVYGGHATIAFPNATLTAPLQAQCLLLLTSLTGRFVFLTIFSLVIEVSSV